MQATVVGLAPCQIKIKVQKRNQHYLKVYYDIIYIYIYIKSDTVYFLKVHRCLFVVIFHFDLILN